MAIADNLSRVRERIAQAAQEAGRAAEEITLLGVTKYVTLKEVAELVAAGCRDLGESRPQELWHKATEAREEIGTELCWHLVGHLQRNKVRRTLPVVHLIHSVDSRRLLEAIDREARSLKQQTAEVGPVRVLLEVNTSGDAAKHGLGPEEVEPLLATAEEFERVAICGLMTMAAREGGAQVAAKNFEALRSLRDQLEGQVPNCVRLSELSMGMSGDYAEAIRAGATIVRVGSALWE